MVANFHVLGLGPIGSLFAHHLRRSVPANHSITLIHKSLRQSLLATERGRICVEHDGLASTSSGFFSETFEAAYPNPSYDRKKQIRDFNAVAQDDGPRPEIEASRGLHPITSLFITTKAHQTLPAIERLLPRLSPNSTIVLLQNGMGIYDELIYHIFRNPERRPHFVLASITHGAFLKSMNDVVHTGLGEIEFAVVPDQAGRRFEAGLEDESIPKFERKLRITDITEPNDPQFEHYQSLRNTVAAMALMSDLNVSWKPISQVQLSMQRKVVVNSIVNPLTALLGCRNGDVFKTESGRRIMKRVCQEAAAAFAAQITADTHKVLDELSASDVAPSGVAMGRVPQGLTRDSLEAEVLRVTELTKGNISSMLSDIRQGKKTEIRFLNGYLAKLGRTYRVPMPTTMTLLNLIKMRTAIPLDQML